MKLYRAYKEWPLPPKALFINLNSSFQASSLPCCGPKSPFLLEVCPVLGLKCIELSRLWTSQWAWLTPGELLLTSTQGSFFFSEAGHLARHSFGWGTPWPWRHSLLDPVPCHLLMLPLTTVSSSFLTLTSAVAARQWQQMAVDLPGDGGLEWFLFCQCLQQLCLPVWPYLFTRTCTNQS